MIQPRGQYYLLWNPGRLLYQGVSFITSFVERNIKQMIEQDHSAKGYEKAFAYLMDYLNDINPNYAKLVQDEYATAADHKELVNTAIEDGIYINIPPAMDGLSMEDVIRLRDKYHAYKTPVTFGVEQRDGSIKYITTKKPVMIAEEYFYLLYKMPHQRCAGISYVNQYRTPIKPSSIAKQQYSITRTPIKYGEDEIRNILLAAGPAVAARIMGLYANSAPAVNMLGEHLLFSDNPAKLWEIGMSTEEIIKTNAIQNVAKHIFSCLGISVATNTSHLEHNPYEDLELPNDK